MDVRIFVLQRGWVVVGKYSKKDSECCLQNAFAVRNWGTTKGLGELASEGPKTATKLDPMTTTKFHELTSIFDIECTHPSWQEVCKDPVVNEKHACGCKCCTKKV